ncbi:MULTISPECIES: hypothetical protein [unclassified Tenacibaculum]|uniref:hypothetical protein n=1 Tax=unclassified Tenacibaculum TaxID=2635139 RepID=UPI001F34AD24|nr:MULTISPECIES: hypothetical protein [unclassified Tenacibaculum]MCF2876115.1 hypothetical protein [Tenacibaculum sp. Cn5-1]MCF2936190.1 hypothetical protein [Tenacibaculum sp. Cn5-34]MCG7512751.1 hypothetical protein [Tenacibaculum sp. Cn5-46]
MKLEFNKLKKEISIKDEVANHTWLIIILMAVNVFNMAFQLSYISFKKNELLFIGLAILALVSILVIFFFFTKRSWKSMYKMEEIEGVEVKKIYGRERIFLKLLNGKRRSFPILRNLEEIENLKKTLTNMGIKLV